MRTAQPANSASHSLTEGEVEEFRLLLDQHARVRLPCDEARVLASQLLHLLALIRDVAVSAAMAEDGDVDKSSCQNDDVEQLI